MCFVREVARCFVRVEKVTKATAEAHASSGTRKAASAHYDEGRRKLYAECLAKTVKYWPADTVEKLSDALAAIADVKPSTKGSS